MSVLLKFQTNKIYCSNSKRCVFVVKSTRNRNIVTCYSNVGVSGIVVNGYFTVAEAEQLLRSFEAEYGISEISSV